MSVLDNVVDEAESYLDYVAEEESSYNGLSKEFLTSVINDVNANHKPKSGNMLIHLTYLSKHPVSSTLFKKYADYISNNAKKVTSGIYGYGCAEFVEGNTKFYLALLSREINVKEFIENMKPYLIPESSIDLIDIGFSYIVK